MDRASLVERVVSFFEDLRMRIDRHRGGDSRHDQMDRAIPEIAAVFLTVAAILLIVLLAVRMT